MFLFSACHRGECLQDKGVSACQRGGSSQAEGVCLCFQDDIGTGALEVKEYFVNFAFPGITETPASINGVQLKLPTVSALTQPLEFDTRCPGEGYRYIQTFSLSSFSLS